MEYTDSRLNSWGGNSWGKVWWSSYSIIPFHWCIKINSLDWFFLWITSAAYPCISRVVASNIFWIHFRISLWYHCTDIIKVIVIIFWHAQFVWISIRCFYRPWWPIIAVSSILWKVFTILYRRLSLTSSLVWICRSMRLINAAQWLPIAIILWFKCWVWDAIDWVSIWHANIRWKILLLIILYLSRLLKR